MQAALLSDVHGNRIALDAVLSELAEEAVDRIVFLGDIALFGPQPKEALSRVRDLRCQVVLGNTDAWALEPVVPAGGDEDRRRFYAVELWSAEQLTDDDREFIRAFPPTLTLKLGAPPSGRATPAASRSAGWSRTCRSRSRFLSGRSTW